MTVPAYITDHFVIRSQVIVLVVLHAEPLGTALAVHLSRQVTGGTRDPSTCGSGTCYFLLPLPVVRCVYVGTGVGIVVAGHAGFHGGVTGVKGVCAVTGRTRHLPVGHIRLHGDASLRRGHGRQLLGQPHTVMTAEETIRLDPVTGSAHGMRWVFHPCLARGCVAVAVQTVDASARMRRIGPLSQQLWIVPAMARTIVCSNGQMALTVWMLLEITSSKVTERRDSALCQVRFGSMLHQKILIEGAIIMKIMAAGGAAGLKGQSHMTRTLVTDVRMATEALVHRHGDTDRPGEIWNVLTVTGDTQPRIQRGDTVGVAWVGKLLGRMRIMSGFELGGVAFEASLLLDPHHGRMAYMALRLNLVMAMTGRAR